MSLLGRDLPKAVQHLQSNDKNLTYRSSRMSLPEPLSGPTWIPYEWHAGFFLEFAGSLRYGTIVATMECTKGPNKLTNGPNNFTERGGNMKTNRRCGTILAATAVIFFGIVSSAQGAVVM